MRIFLVCRVRQLLLFVIVVLLVSMFLDNSLPDKHAHTQLQSHMETAWKAGRIFREHFQQTASCPLNFFSTSRACIFQIQLYVTPAKLATCVCTPDTHTHTSKTHAVLILLIFFLRCISVVPPCDKINSITQSIFLNYTDRKRQLDG